MPSTRTDLLLYDRSMGTFPCHTVVSLDYVDDEYNRKGQGRPWFPGSAPFKHKRPPGIDTINGQVLGIDKSPQKESAAPRTK